MHLLKNFGAGGSGGIKSAGSTGGQSSYFSSLNLTYSLFNNIVDRNRNRSRSRIRRQ